MIDTSDLKQQLPFTKRLPIISYSTDKGADPMAAHSGSGLAGFLSRTIYGQVDWGFVYLV